MANKEDEKILSQVREHINIASEALGDTRRAELEDLKFLAASPDNQWQWPDYALATRSPKGSNVDARPCLTINKLPQHVNQVTNEIRQNMPNGKVIPANNEADVEVAEIYDGMVRAIQYESDADIAYATASMNQVAMGEGYFRILTDYVDENSFDQELKIGRIRNSFGVLMDPMIQDPCGSDAEWAAIYEDVPKNDYRRQYPKAATISVLEDWAKGNEASQAWLTENTVRIAEYFYIHREVKTLNLYQSGQSAIEGTEEDAFLRMQQGKPVKTRRTEIRSVKWLKTNGYEILDRGDWLGRWIPIVRVVGNEFEIENKLHISGLVRNAKDAQRMYNYWVSQEAEMLALAPKAPYVGAAGQFEGFEEKWATANVRHHPYLEYNPIVDDATQQPLPPPQRSQPPMAQTGLIQAKLGAAEDIKATTGQYNASLGMESNERSGKAILARQREGDIGTYHYVDNLARAIRFATRQLVDLIPKIYDTARIARIIGEDGESKTVKINPMQQEPVRKIMDPSGNVIEKIYNPGVGKYDVRVVTGPGYATKRQEALEAMAQLLQGNPQLWQIAGDLFVKNLDWPGAQELYRRFAKTIPPELLQDEDNPALLAAQKQIQEMGTVIQQMEGMLRNAQNSFEAREVQIREFEAQIKAYDAETKRLSAMREELNEQQAQEIVNGTIDTMIAMGDLQVPQNQPPVRGDQGML